MFGGFGLSEKMQSWKNLTKINWPQSAVSTYIFIIVIIFCCWYTFCIPFIRQHSCWCVCICVCLRTPGTAFPGGLGVMCSRWALHGSVFDDNRGSGAGRGVLRGRCSLLCISMHTKSKFTLHTNALSIHHPFHLYWYFVVLLKPWFTASFFVHFLSGSIFLIMVVWMTFSQISTTLVLLRVCTRSWSLGSHPFIR